MRSEQSILKLKESKNSSLISDINDFSIIPSGELSLKIPLLLENFEFEEDILRGIFHPKEEIRKASFTILSHSSFYLHQDLLKEGLRDKSLEIRLLTVDNLNFEERGISYSYLLSLCLADNPLELRKRAYQRICKDFSDLLDINYLEIDLNSISNLIECFSLESPHDKQLAFDIISCRQDIEGRVEYLLLRFLYESQELFSLFKFLSLVNQNSLKERIFNVLVKAIKLSFYDFLFISEWDNLSLQEMLSLIELLSFISEEVNYFNTLLTFIIKKRKIYFQKDDFRIILNKALFRIGNKQSFKLVFETITRNNKDISFQGLFVVTDDFSLSSLACFLAILNQYLYYFEVSFLKEIYHRISPVHYLSHLQYILINQQDFTDVTVKKAILLLLNTKEKKVILSALQNIYLFNNEELKEITYTLRDYPKKALTRYFNALLESSNQKIQLKALILISQSPQINLLSSIISRLKSILNYSLEMRLHILIAFFSIIKVFNIPFSQNLFNYLIPLFQDNSTEIRKFVLKEVFTMSYNQKWIILKRYTFVDYSECFFNLLLKVVKEVRELESIDYLIDLFKFRPSLGKEIFLILKERNLILEKKRIVDIYLNSFYLIQNYLENFFINESIYQWEFLFEKIKERQEEGILNKFLRLFTVMRCDEVLLKQVLEGSTEERRQAIHILSLLKTKYSYIGLLYGCRDSDMLIRSEASLAIKDGFEREEVVDFLIHSPKSKVRHLARWYINNKQGDFNVK